MRIVWKELASFSPFCGRQDLRFMERRIRFNRILSNTSGFTCHKDNCLGRKQAVYSIQTPKTCQQIKEFLGLQVSAGSESPNTLLAKPLYEATKWGEWEMIV
jgi:hypothetical protein